MSIKTIVLFLIGLAIWLVVTNFQTISTSIASMLNEQEAISEVAGNLEDDEPTETKDNFVANIASDSQVTDHDDEIIEEYETTTDTTSPDTESIKVETANLDEAQSNELNKIDESTESALGANQPTATPHIPNSYGYPLGNWNTNPFTNYQNSSMWMNPMMGMMMPMMSMMGTMMNPGMYMNPMTMMNHPITAMTQKQNMEAMMKSMDPKMMFAMMGQPVPNYDYDSDEVPEQVPVAKIPGFPTQLEDNWPKNKVSPEISREAKMHAFQTAMAMSPLSMRNMISMMANKIPVEEGISWDDAVEAMKLRANEVNFKFVGSSPLWKEIEAVTGEPSTKVEMFRFCDAAVARNILDEVPEFIVFLPCKIALIEDAEGQLWVMTLDWDVSWMDYAQNPNNNLSKELRADAKKIRDNIQYIMEGAATGDF